MFLQSVGIKLLRGEETARVEPLLRGNDGVLVGGSMSVPTGVVDFAAATCALLRDCQVIAGARVTGFHRRRPGGGGVTRVAVHPVPRLNAPILITEAGRTVEGPSCLADVLSGDEHGVAIFEAPLVICCAGLQSDRLATLDGLLSSEKNNRRKTHKMKYKNKTAAAAAAYGDDIRIVPMKETYYSLARGPAAAPESFRGLKHLVYSCPSPELFAAAAASRAGDGYYYSCSAAKWFLACGGGGARFVRGLSSRSSFFRLGGRGAAGTASAAVGDGVVELGATRSLSLARDFYDDVEVDPRFEYRKFDLADFVDTITWLGLDWFSPSSFMFYHWIYSIFLSQLLIGVFY